MRDFSLCRDRGCPSRMRCRRFTAEPPVANQRFADFQRNGQPNCWMFEPKSKTEERSAS